MAGDADTSFLDRHSADGGLVAPLDRCSRDARAHAAAAAALALQHGRRAGAPRSLGSLPERLPRNVHAVPQTLTLAHSKTGRSSRHCRSGRRSGSNRG